MSNNNNAAPRLPARDGEEQNDEQQQPHHTIDNGEAQTIRAPHGNMQAYLRNGMIYVEGKHLVSIRGNELHRTFSSARELLDSALFFRIDVLRLAVDEGITSIVARDRVTRNVWRVDIDTFRTRGQPYSHPKYGDQWGLSLDRWEPVRPPQKPQQLSLGGGL